ncbi:MAG: DMT family transporter [Limnothrix sp.]|nr:DMT family transporter [Limnothrix sp.]
MTPEAQASPSDDSDNPKEEATTNQSTSQPPTSESDSQNQNNRHSSLAFLWLILGLIALSSTAIFIKLSIREISAEATVFNRLWIATLAFTGLNWLQREQPPSAVSESKMEGGHTTQNSGAADYSSAAVTGQQQKLPWATINLLLALGFVHLVGRYLWTWSLTSTTAANGAMLANMPPLFTALGGWLFLGQRFDRRFLSGLAIAVIGAITLAIGDWIQPKEALFGTSALLGDGAALLSSVFYAASFLLVEKLRQHLSTSKILVWRCAIGLLLATPIVWAIDSTIFPISTMGWIAVIGLALISEVTGHGLIVYSLKHFSSTFVTIVLLLEPAPVAAIAWLWFGEFLDPLNILGFFLITLGIYLAKTGTGATGSNNNSPNLIPNPSNTSTSQDLALETPEISGES